MTSPEPATLLLVDDNPTNLQVLYQTLDGRGYRLLIARNGEDALKIARKARPSLVLLDIMMPEMDGYQVLTLLQNMPETQNSAVIFLSALNDTADKVRGLDKGAVDYITKPFQADEVIARVDTHLTIQHLRLQLELSNRRLAADNQQILATVGEGIVGLDKEGVCTFLNPAGERILQTTAEQLQGQGFQEQHQATLPNGDPYLPEQWPVQQSLKHAETVQTEELFFRADGQAIPVEYTSSPILDNGRPNGAVLVFKDISKRKADEQALKEALAQVEELSSRLQAENAYLQQEIRTEKNPGDIIGTSPVLKKVLAQVRQVAPTDSTVLIAGESGTGKELIARAIHELSQRRERPLIKVNCGAIPANLIESELFGHEKGAFTGAVKARQGHFELADGGSIFLDEFGELPLDAQVKLLRVLQEQEIIRVGSSEVIKVDVRIIAATHRNLPSMVEAGEFRMDLYYRMSVFPVTVPSLAERGDDILQLARYFLKRYAERLGKPLTRLSADSERLLLAYHWPGNIRELQNVIERAAILSSGEELELDETVTPAAVTDSPPDASKEIPESVMTLAEHEAAYICRILEKTHWQIDGKQGAARLLDLPASTLRSRMKKLGIRKNIS